MDSENVHHYTITALRGSMKLPCHISYFYDEASKVYRMHASFDRVPDEEFVGRDVFACFCDLREHLAAYDFILLCNGARRNTYPSRMSRDMGDGTLIYVTTMGQQAFEKDLVNLFDEAPAEQIASVKEQREFHQRWLDQFGKGR